MGDIDDRISEIQALLGQRHATQMSSTFVCEPDAVLPGARFTFRARVFAHPERLARLAPVIRCVEIPAAFDVALHVERRPEEGFIDVTGAASAETLEANKVYHFLLYPVAAAEPIAQCRLKVISADVVERARREIPPLIFEPQPRAGGPRHR